MSGEVNVVDGEHAGLGRGTCCGTRGRHGEISADELLRCIRAGYRSAREHTNDDPPRRLSSRFVYEVAKAVHTSHFEGHCLRTIKVADSAKRIRGEWLVDACITEQRHFKNPHNRDVPISFINRVVFAMESESHTGTPEFNTDFAKLLHLNAKVKLYLNGIDQSKRRAQHYMERRRGYAGAVRREGVVGMMLHRFLQKTEKLRTERRKH